IFKKFTILILIMLWLINSVEATQTQYKLFSKTNDYLTGKFDGTAIGTDGKLKVWYKLKEQQTSQEIINKELWDMLYLEDKKIIYSTGTPAAIIEYEREKEKFILKNNYKLANDITAVSKLYYDEIDKKILYAAIPNGNIYIYPDKLLCNLPSNYIYDLIRINNYYYAAGTNGRIFRIDAQTGAFNVFYKLKDKNVLTLSRYKQFLIAGGSNTGLLYLISLSDPNNKSKALENFGNAEIRKILVTQDNKIYAAVNFFSGQQKSQQMNQPQTFSEADASEVLEMITENFMNEMESAAGEGDPKAQQSKRSTGMPPMFAQQIRSSALYYVTEQSKTLVAELNNDGINDFTIDNEQVIYIASSRRNYLYRIIGKEYDIVYKTKNGAITKLCLNSQNNLAIFGASNPAEFFEIDMTFKSAEYLSDIIDLNYKSFIGRPEIENIGEIEMQLRAGNTSAPDELWSEWLNPFKTAQQLTGRYSQFRIVLKSKDSGISKINLPYKQFNIAPILKSVNIQAQRKNQSGGGRGGAQNNRPPSPQEIQEQMQNQDNDPKTNYTVRWSAEDPNNDRLIYHIYYLYENGDWIKFPFDKHYTKNTYNWNTNFFPDGRYRFKIIASDELDNHGEYLTDEIISDYVVIDNTPPEILIVIDDKSIIINAIDKLNIIKNCEYSVNGGDWKMLQPRDGLFDSTAEVFILSLKGIKGTVTFRISDADNNIGLKSVIVR
ncbi:MAG TPA: hypothetical protein PLM75_06290, partial [bacterium]|nr:hypothetical protein [bacterium]